MTKDLEERVQKIEGDVGFLKESFRLLSKNIDGVTEEIKEVGAELRSVSGEFKEVGNQLANLVTKVDVFLQVWGQAIPLKLVVIVLFIICGCFFGAEVFKQILKVPLPL